MLGKISESDAYITSLHAQFVTLIVTSALWEVYVLTLEVTVLNSAHWYSSFINDDDNDDSDDDTDNDHCDDDTDNDHCDDYKYYMDKIDIHDIYYSEYTYICLQFVPKKASKLLYSIATSWPKL